MSIIIKKAENGYIVEEFLSENDEYCYASYVYSDLVSSLRHIADEFESGSRYDEKRIYVIEAPGDKHAAFKEEHAKVIWGRNESSNA